MRILTLTLLFLSILLSCQKSKNQENKNLIWSTQFTEESEALVNTDPLIWEDKLIFFRDVLNFYSDETALVALNKNNGDKIWTWRGIKFLSQDSVEIPYQFNEMAILDGIVIGKDKFDLIGVDVNNGNTLWKLPFNSSFTMINGAYEGKLFCVSESKGTQSEVVIHEIDHLAGTKTEIQQIFPETQGKVLNFNSFQVYKNKSGEYCMLIILWEAFVPVNNDTEFINYLYHYNLDQKKIIYKKELPGIYGLTNLMVNESFIFGIGRYLVSFDINSGDVIMSQEQAELVSLPESYFEYPYVYAMHNNRTNEFVKQNLYTGKTLWKTSLGGHQCRSIKKFRDRLYLVAADGLLYIINSENGQLTDHFLPPVLVDEKESQSRFFDDRFVLDEATGYAYLTDYRNLFCLDLIE